MKLIFYKFTQARKKRSNFLFNLKVSQKHEFDVLQAKKRNKNFEKYSKKAWVLFFTNTKITFKIFYIRKK